MFAGKWQSEKKHMRQISFFPPDSRSSDAKRSIIEMYGRKRLTEMLKSPEFQTFGFHYWDREAATAGYGGYTYDGRYLETAKKMIHFYGLTPGDTVFEVGCGKGYLLVEFLRLGMEVQGVDVSKYAIEHAHPELRESIFCGDMREIELPEKGFDLVLAKDTLPHFEEPDVEPVIKKCMRASRQYCFFEIEVARNDFEQEMLYEWDLTHKTRRPPKWWLDVFDRVGYQGDYHFKVLIQDPSLPVLE
jgi:protein-L-isoaspartate(D-aspartate) O-methyltransferase